jgi:dihydroxy-acid dehydratase
VRDGIRDAGGIAIEFPVHPIQETGKRPTAALDRNLAYLGLVEVLYGYPLDGVVLTTGCDKTTPACLMAAATVNIPAIACRAARCSNGFRGRAHRLGHHRLEGAPDCWRPGDRLCQEFIDMVASSAPSRRPLQHHGHGRDDEFAGRGARHVAAGLRGHPGPYRERGRSPTRPASASSTWCART